MDGFPCCQPIEIDYRSWQQWLNSLPMVGGKHRDRLREATQGKRNILRRNYQRSNRRSRRRCYRRCFLSFEVYLFNLTRILWSTLSFRIFFIPLVFLLPFLSAGTLALSLSLRFFQHLRFPASGFLSSVTTSSSCYTGPRVFFGRARKANDDNMNRRVDQFLLRIAGQPSM